MGALISIDPGVSSGVSVFTFSDTSPAELKDTLQFTGGAEALYSNLEGLNERYGGADYVCEDFQARPQQGFGYTTKSLEPLVCIGGLIALGIISRGNKRQLQSPILQYFAGGKSKAEKRKAQHKWLRENGLYVTGKMVDAPDADDVRSSMAHAIAWFRRQNHTPTIEKYFPKED